MAIAETVPPASAARPAPSEGPASSECSAPADWNGALPDSPPSLADAQRYCQRLASTHYENFPVATLLLPARLRPHFYSLYAYCRWADDLGDETGDPQRALRLLDCWEQELRACYAGHPRHPVFVALRQTIMLCDIPAEPFHDLINAFRQDQVQQRYPTFADVLGYCRYSANPVGRLVLYACGYRDTERQRLSDFTCTALQLANFWQDVRRDYAIGRIYLPLDDMERYGYAESDLAAHRATPAFRALLKEMVARTWELFRAGLPLTGLVDRRLAMDIELFSRGGMEILRMIERQNYDVLSRRPKLGGVEMGLLTVSVLLRRLFA